ncbi:MAG: NAD(P)H-hydrate dehydratase [Planctomycetaceae bacterium]
MSDYPIQHVFEVPAPPRRPDDAHKGTFGRVLIVAGSRGMSGAAALAGLGALRGGAGLVYVAVPVGILPIVASIEPSYLTIALPEDENGRVGGKAEKILDELIPKHEAVAIGPGCGQSTELTSLARQLFASVELPMVIDADGLNALAGSGDALRAHAGPRILTPHPGEFARLISSDVKTVQANREELAAKFARDNGIVLVLKGQGTVITDGERLAVNATGNSGMATGGTGDVLTGLIAALLAQGMSAFDAARLAAHLHGLAGDLAAAELTKPALIASDLPRYLPAAWSQLGDAGG